jgi:excisionase family DNA binding protein
MLDCTATYSAQQIAKILRMSKGKVYKLAKSGDMPSVQFAGGPRRFLGWQVKEWLDQLAHHKGSEKHEST